MGKALQCDKCKKCYVGSEVEGFILRFVNPSVYTSKSVLRGERICSLYSDKGFDYYVDLCPECSKNFVEFMNADIKFEEEK